jgi:hypothetical protein
MGVEHVGLVLSEAMQENGPNRLSISYKRCQKVSLTSEMVLSR